MCGGDIGFCVATAGGKTLEAESVCNMSLICSGVKDATSAASTSGAICTGAVVGGTVMGGGPADVDARAGGTAESTGAGTAGGIAGGASLPLFNIQIPTRRSEIRAFGRRRSSRSSM